MNCASTGNTVSKYHLEAAIAWWSTKKTDTNEKWENVLHLYDSLLKLEYSPVAALNRTYAISKVQGKKAAIKEAEKLNMQDSHFYFALLGELYTGDNNEKARQNLLKAIALSRSDSGKKAFQSKLDKI